MRELEGVEACWPNTYLLARQGLLEPHRASPPPAPYTILHTLVKSFTNHFLPRLNFPSSVRAGVWMLCTLAPVVVVSRTMVRCQREWRPWLSDLGWSHHLLEPHSLLVQNGARAATVPSFPLVLLGGSDNLSREMSFIPGSVNKNHSCALIIHVRSEDPKTRGICVSLVLDSLFFLIQSEA